MHRRLSKDFEVELTPPKSLGAKDVILPAPLGAPNVTSAYFFFSRPGEMKQQEDGTAVLAWTPKRTRSAHRYPMGVGSRFQHRFKISAPIGSKGPPHLGKGVDSHHYGFQFDPGLSAVKKATTLDPQFDGRKSDWTFTESMRFTDTVLLYGYQQGNKSVADKRITHPWGSLFEMKKRGRNVSLFLDYYNYHRLAGGGKLPLTTKFSLTP